MTDAVAAQDDFSAQLAAATAEAEREEAAYLATRNGGAQVEETTSEERSSEDLLKEIEELKAKLNAGEKQGDEEEPTDQQSQEGGADEAEEINGTQITAEDYEQWSPWYELVAKGEALPDEAFAVAKERFGVTDREMVTDYMRGRLASQSAATNAFAVDVRSAAGEVGYDGLMSWAADSLTEAEVAEYNSAVNSKDVKLAKAATQALAFRMKAEGGIVPKPLNGRTAVQAADVFSSMDEMVNAINDPRYDKDPAYRRTIEAKVERSNASSSVSVTKGSRAY